MTGKKKEPTSSGKMHLSKKCPDFTWRNAVNMKKQKGLSSDLFPEKKPRKKKKQRAVFMGKLKR